MRQCPHCQVEMVPGRRQDKADNFAVNLESWLPGAPDDEVLDWFSETGQAMHVTTYGCPKCGLLLSYINPDQLSKKS